jgi:hypothetical protein
MQNCEATKGFLIAQICRVKRGGKIARRITNLGGASCYFSFLFKVRTAVTNSGAESDFKRYPRMSPLKAFDFAELPELRGCRPRTTRHHRVSFRSPNDKEGLDKENKHSEA